jgi:hypothetical protein
MYVVFTLLFWVFSELYNINYLFWVFSELYNINYTYPEEL